MASVPDCHRDEKRVLSNGAIPGHIVIDFHVHPWTKSFMLKNPPIVKACTFFNIREDDLPSSTSQLLAEMDEAGVKKAVILGQDTHATVNPSFKNYTITNDELLRIARKHEDRFIPFAGVDPNAGVVGQSELRRAIKELGFRGLKIHASANSIYLNDQRKMYPVYEMCQDFGVPVLLHTGTTALGDCDIKYSKPELLDEIGQEFPDLRIIMAHFGWPWSDVCLAIAQRNPNFYIDISGWKPKYLPSSLIPYMNGPLQDKFLFGTDYPMIRHSPWMRSFREDLSSKLKPGISDKILTGNAERLLNH
jgi:predicted TIM-barrel fold metal-dependent hydrolase